MVYTRSANLRADEAHCRHANEKNAGAESRPEEEEEARRRRRRRRKHRSHAPALGTALGHRIEKFRLPYLCRAAT